MELLPTDKKTISTFFKKTLRKPIQQSKCVGEPYSVQPFNHPSGCWDEAVLLDHQKAIDHAFVLGGFLHQTHNQQP